MAELLEEVTLSEFLVNIRDLLERNNQDEELSMTAIVTIYFESNFVGFQNELGVNVLLDCPLRQEDEPIYEALAYCIPVNDIVLTDSAEARLVPRMLSLALTPENDDNGIPPCIVLKGIRMSETEAEAIFEAIQMSNMAHQITFDLDTTRVDEGVINALARHIANSDMFAFDISRIYGTPDGMLSRTMFDTIFDAIASSTSMDMLFLSPSLVAPSDVDGATETIANSLLQSSSLTNLTLCDGNNAGSFSSADIYSSLMRSVQVQNFDLLVNHDDNGSMHKLRLSRAGNPWKKFLTQDIPLKHWPLILAQTNEWNDFQSHTSLDAMYFLVRAKSAVLLQNIHRRKRRKRKRFQFESS